MKFNDAIFMGEMRDELKNGDDTEIREGLGIMVYKQGRIYEGFW